MLHAWAKRDERSAANSSIRTARDLGPRPCGGRAPRTRAWSGFASGCLGVYGRTGSLTAAAWTMSGYFTNTTALLIAIVFTGVALGRHFFARPSLLGAATLSVLLVGIVQRLLLHGLKVRQGPDAVADTLLHVLLPILVPLF